MMKGKSFGYYLVIFYLFNDIYYSYLWGLRWVNIFNNVFEVVKILLGEFFFIKLEKDLKES